ncbi:MAG TPA: hypothetical protein VNT32_11770, partial [Thermoleophilaceae bacterium]|nr:hypothetical protein [Thermoleophilaceae bacterium]
AEDRDAEALCELLTPRFQRLGARRKRGSAVAACTRKPPPVLFRFSPEAEVAQIRQRARFAFVLVTDVDGDRFVFAVRIAGGTSLLDSVGRAR